MKVLTDLQKRIFAIVKKENGKPIPPVEHLNLKLDPQGFLITNEQMETSLKGLFAAGDCRSKHFRQIGTAINDGIIAVLTIRDVL